MLGRMTTYYAILTRNMGSQTIKAGKYVDDSIVDTTAYLSAGGLLVASTDAYVAAAAAIATAMWKKGRGATECDALMLSAYQVSTTVYANAHDVVVSAGFASFYHPLADELVSVVNDFQMVTGACAIAVQPKLPCKLQVRITDAANAVSGTCVLLGTGADGTPLNQTITIHGGTRTVVTDDAYASLTSATLTITAGAGGGKNLGIGCKGEVGLPIPKGATNVAVNKVAVDHANEAVGTVDATARTLIPTTPCNGTHDYDVWFSYHLPAAAT